MDKNQPDGARKTQEASINPSTTTSQTNSQTDVLVAGCGAMGLPMAKALQGAGFNTHGYDVRDSHEFGDFAPRMLENPLRRAADSCLLVVVRNQQQINQLCFDDEAVFKQTLYPRTLIISSTVSPRFIHDLRQRLPEDITLVDAPMSGAPFSAQDRTLSFMLGGPEAAIGSLMPLFQAMGTKIFHLGSSGQGMMAKVLNNYVAAINVVAVRRCIQQATSAGMDYSNLLDVMQQSSGGNWFASNIQRIDWAEQNYSPDNTIGILEKDVNSALDFIENLPQAGIDPTRDPLDAELLNALRNLPPFPV